MFKQSMIRLLGLPLMLSLQPVFEPPVRAKPPVSQQDKTQQNLNCQAQRRLLSEAGDRLLYPSESDYPFHYFFNRRISSLPSPQEFTKLIKQQEQQVTQVNFDDFFNQSLNNLRSSGGDAATIRRYQSLRQVFKDKFTKLTIYRVGKTQVKIYIVGVNSSCGMAGFKTISIET